MWNKPNDKPKAGRIIAVLKCHPKEHLPMSYQIQFGEVEYSNDKKSWRANTGDMSGMGCYCPDEEDMVAWCYWDEISFPSWAKHDKHWGPVK